jgi:hypothetical protein
LVKGFQCLVKQIADHVFELVARELDLQMQWFAIPFKQIFFPHLGERLRGKFNLGLFGGAHQTSQRLAILARINAVLFFKRIGQVIHQPLVKVIAAQARVAVAGAHFDHARIQLDDRDVERAAAQVVYRYHLPILDAVEAIRQRSRRRLVDDTLDRETGNLACVFGGLARRVRKIRRHRDDGARDLFAQVTGMRFISRRMMPEISDGV